MITDPQVAAHVARTDRFIDDVRELIEATTPNPRSPCADVQHRTLQRIADTLDAVPYVTMCNMATVNAAMGGVLMEIIELRLMYVGCGPKLDFASAEAFLDAFQPVIDKALRRLRQ